MTHVGRIVIGPPKLAYEDIWGRDAVVNADLWHVCEKTLHPGDVISPGRWGSIILAQGQSHRFFFREHLLELWRVKETAVPVSRLNCCFAFEDHAEAVAWAEEGEHIYPVVPVDPSAAAARLDMLWITWLGEPAAPAVTFQRLASYWSGTSTASLAAHANPQWEWLFACGLRVLHSK
jgi:hypothetical protein